MSDLIMLVFLVSWSFFVSVSLSAVPLTNPVSALYGPLAYTWTNDMVNWSCVVNVNDYNNDFNSGQNAVLKLCPNGGVLYYPSGNYTFKSDINIVSNVVIRGDTTNNEMAKNGKNPGNLNPTTIFNCPDLKHMGIYNSNGTSHNIGVVNVNLVNCAVMLWPQLTPYNPSYQSYFANANGIIGSGYNKLVFSNKITGVSLGNPSPGSEFPDVSIPSDPWPYRFGVSISVYSDNNALIANNLIAKTGKTFKTNVAGYSNVDYPYDNRYGIDLNQIQYGNLLAQTSGGPCLANETNSPYYFRRNLTIRDNYVYQNGRVGISWSGGDDQKSNGIQGLGTQVYNNHVEVENGTYCWSIDGTHPCSGSSTNENRGYNEAGFGNNLTLNTGHINRQCIPPDCKYETVDGEGILHQCSSNSNGLRNIWYKNDLTGGSSGYMLYYKLYNVDNNILISNKVNSDQSIGAVFDSNHNEHHGNTCQNNSPSCTGIPP